MPADSALSFVRNVGIVAEVPENASVLLVNAVLLRNKVSGM